MGDCNLEMYSKNVTTLISTCLDQPKLYRSPFSVLKNLLFECHFSLLYFGWIFPKIFCPRIFKFNETISSLHNICWSNRFVSPCSLFHHVNCFSILLPIYQTRLLVWYFETFFQTSCNFQNFLLNFVGKFFQTTRLIRRLLV